VNRVQTENARGVFVLTDDGRHAPALPDQIAAWVNEGGAGGEVVRAARVSSAAAIDGIATQPTA
jgi:hypothetical protein